MLGHYLETAGEQGRQTGLAYDTSSLSAVALNSTIAGIEFADAILFVGSSSTGSSRAGEVAVSFGMQCSSVGGRVPSTVPRRSEDNHDLSIPG